MTKPAALITGSSRGIGLATARALASAGTSVAIHGIADDEELVQAVHSLSDYDVPVSSIAGDISEIEQHEAMLDAAEAAIGPLSLLVNNAGVSVAARGDPLQVSEASFERCMAVNAKAMFFMCQAFARRLLARDRNDGRTYTIINITSSNAVAVSLNRAEYCASKAAAAMISKTFAVRLGAERIAVYDIQPGVIATSMTAPAMADYERRVHQEGLTLLPEIGQPEQVAQIVTTLASGAVPYTTGQVIAADGGLSVQRF